MTAPEYINDAHEALLRADDALSVTDVASEIHGTTKPNKTQIKAAERQLKELNGLGLIAPEFRTGGVAFYRLIVAPAVQVGGAGVADIAQPAECVAASGDSEGGETDAPLNFATSPELQYLAPEDYEMPPADPKLLAMANRAISGQLDEFRAQTAANAFSALSAKHETLKHQITELRTRAAEQAAQYQADIARISSGLAAERQAMNNAINEADRLRAELAAERQAREALQEQANAVDVKDAAVGYLIRVFKRDLILRRKLDSARLAALGAVRAGAARAEVLAVVPVGVARRGAEWGDA